MRCAPVFLVLFLLPGCLSKQLRAPVEDHRIQTETIAEMCRSGGYTSACPEELQDDLDAMAQQAKHLDQIIKGESPEEEEEETD